MVPTSAAENAEAKEEVPRATFTNEYDPMPDLYVTKNVKSADDRYPAPEGAEFTFTLKLDGKLAASRPVSYTHLFQRRVHNNRKICRLL